MVKNILYFSAKGIDVNNAKVESISKILILKIVKSTHSLLEHVGFYRKFIKNFSNIVKSLFHFLSQDVQFKQIQICQIVFNTLNDMLISAPIMQPSDWLLLFAIMCDSSDYSIGAVLRQKRDKKCNAPNYAPKVGQFFSIFG